MTNDLQDHDEIPGVEWIVDLSNDAPHRLAKVEYDVNTLISLVDVCAAASIGGGHHTKQNARIFTDYYLRVIRELESRSLIDQRQWEATEHLAPSL